MKSRMKTLAVCAAMALAGSQPACAQLGDILKKAKQGIEAVDKVVGQFTGQEAGAGHEVPVASGGTMINPLASVMDVELVGAYGRSTSENYGTVYLVFKIKMLANKASVGLGGAVDNVKSMAVDQAADRGCGCQGGPRRCRRPLPRRAEVGQADADYQGRGVHRPAGQGHDNVQERARGMGCRAAMTAASAAVGPCAARPRGCAAAGKTVCLGRISAVFGPFHRRGATVAVVCCRAFGGRIAARRGAGVLAEGPPEG